MELDERVEKEINSYIDREEAIANLKKSGVVFPERVEVPDQFINENGKLSVPEDVTELPSENLGYYMSIFNGLAAYYRVIVACADIDYATAKRVCNYVEAKVMNELRKNRADETVTVLKAERDTHDLVMKVREWRDKRRAMFKIAEAVLEGVEDIVFMLSREITRAGSWAKNEGWEKKWRDKREED